MIIETDTISQLRLSELKVSEISDLFDVDWGDIEWAFKNNILSSNSIIEYADHLLAHKSKTIDDREIELLTEMAVLNSPYSEVIEENRKVELSRIISELCQGRVADKGRSKDKWLYLILYWLFSRRQKYPNAIELVDRLWADFDYPDEIAKFVSYMPADNGYDPSAHSREDNLKRLYSKWQEYIEANRSRYI